ncbi:hypothetical protein [Amycolatopsis australiensis]|uniref:Uncharacterized protein n=1 Tax=Amycolatopsis australiensis TaxID=546364 RepID=A0A1K1T3T0_9PSEU|nr:hypothetical protein [Amycolatopsis australiensis]SFW91297.1 hypothetical protein SAMN04489730_7903 [Amycolatopsis australiensis]
MGFFIGVGVLLAVVLVVAFVLDRADRRRGVKHGLLRPRGRRPRIGDAGYVGNDLRHYEPRVRGEDRPAPREDDM